MTCHHKYKSIVDMKIIDYAKIANVKNEDGISPVVCSGTYKVFRCLDCKCLVWEEEWKKEDGE